MWKKICFSICLGLLLVSARAGSAASLLVSSGQTHIVTGTETFDSIRVQGTLIVESGGILTFNSQSEVDGPDPGGHIIVNGGAVTGNARFDMDGTATITMNDGLFRVNSTVKFPDNAPGPVYIILNGGILSAHDMETYVNRNALMTVGGGMLRLDDVSDNNRDPRDWLDEGGIVPAEGYKEIVIEYVPDGDYTQVSAVPANPNVQFETTASGAPESVSSAALAVTISKPIPQVVSVDYAVTGGTATEGQDYVLTNGTLVFDPNEMSQTIEIDIIDDGIEEENETIEVTLSNPAGDDLELGEIVRHTYTIMDQRPDVEFAFASSVGAEDVTPAGVAVKLSHVWDQTVVVDYRVTGGTADGGGTDYILDDGTLTFEPGVVGQDIIITVVNDAEREGPKTIELLLYGPTNAKLGGITEHTFTIDDDELPLGFTNSVGMDFLLIMPGTYAMGSNGGHWDERPVHDVTISEPFYIQEVEVTADQFRQFDPTYSGGEYATGISWHEAVAFTEWLSEQEGKTYRLATEAQWEYVCRAGTTTPYSSGQSAPAPGTPNPWGVKNMHNTPREWVWDWHGEYPYEDQVDPVGPADGMARVVRGGGLDESNPYYFRSSNRAGIAPGFGGGLHEIGLRVVTGEMPSTPAIPYEAPFVRQGIRNSGHQTQAPDPDTPYFVQRPLLPIPPDNSPRDAIDAAGLHPSFRHHNHSPGMEVCPNGDLLMIIYTSYREYEPEVSLMATRLRFGSDQWDMPTPMFDFPGINDHAPMLWTDGDMLHFFWGCPNLDGASRYPFQWRSSADSGATWDEVRFPVFEGYIGGHSRQPINTALRVGDTIYVSSDGSGGASVLWTSDNNGQTWYDPGGRTGGRHTSFALLDDGRILGMGGKNTGINGYMPKSISSDGAQSWDVSITPFSRLGSNQRPCIARLASGRLFFCSDFQQTSDCYQPAGITEKGALAALSDDGGESWHIKKIPTALRHESRQCDGATLGYSVARQAQNGVIHVITTMNTPCQHFEMNEAWILSGAGAEPPADPGNTGTVNQYQQNYPGGGFNATWSAKLCDDGRYLLHDSETWYYETGQKQYEATYRNGRKVDSETYWGRDGSVRWSWNHDAGADSSVWTQYWPNGQKRVESEWRYGGRIAHGTAVHWDVSGTQTAQYYFTNGALTGSPPPPPLVPGSTIKIDIGATGQPVKEGFIQLNGPPSGAIQISSLVVRNIGVYVWVGEPGATDSGFRTRSGGGDLGIDYVHPDNGSGPVNGRVNVALVGLPLGTYYLTSWHNDSQPAARDPINVSVNGAITSSASDLNVAITQNTVDDNNLGESFVTFTANGTGQPVFVEYRPTTDYPFPDHNLSKCVLNGFILTRTADLSGDGDINMKDLRILVQNWLSQVAGNIADLNFDGKVDFADFNIMALGWLESLNP